MSASDRKRYTITKENRAWLGSLIATASEGWSVTIAPPTRSDDQNRIFHAIVADFVRAIPEYGGVPMDAESWKSLLIVSHAVATSEGGGLRLVPDLEGQGLVQVRESSARMSKSRATSLIEYCMAEAAKRGIQLREAA